MGVIIAILILLILVMVHELGHFFMGRALGIGIEELSIGFGPKIFQKKSKKEILYTLRVLPLGAFVRFTGEDEDNDNPKAMNNQPVWKRFLTVLAGPAMNILMAYAVVAIYLMVIGLAYNAPVVAQLMDGLPAQQAGLQVGDIIESVNGESVDINTVGAGEQVRDMITSAQAGQPLVLGVIRDGEKMEISLTPVLGEDGALQIGIYMGQAMYHFGFVDAVRASGQQIWYVMGEMLNMLKDLIFRGEGVEGVMGPVGTVGFISQQVSQGLDMILNMVWLLSLNLGIMNLLPIPALDGGRLVLLIVEGIRRKPLDRNKEGLVHLIGFGLLIMVMLFFTYKDIIRWITGNWGA